MLGDKEIAIHVAENKRSEAQYILPIGAQAHEYFQRYLKVEYPLSKKWWDSVPYTYF